VVVWPSAAGVGPNWTVGFGLPTTERDEGAMREYIRKQEQEDRKQEQLTPV
jgi:hypothetical protein